MDVGAVIGVVCRHWPMLKNEENVDKIHDNDGSFMIHSLSWANSALIFRLAHFVNFPIPKKQHSTRVESFGMRYTPRKTNIEPQQWVDSVCWCFFLFQRGLSQVSCHFLGWCFFPSLVIMVEVFLGVHLCPPLAERASEFERNSVELLSTNEMCWAESINLSEVEGSRPMSHLIHFVEVLGKSYHESSHWRSVPKSVPPPNKM